MTSSFRRSIISVATAACCLIAAPATALGEELTYTVRGGDTLSSLASRYMVSAAAANIVQRRNRIADPRRIPIGTRLAIPVHLLRYEPIALRIATFSGPVSVGSAVASKGQVLGEGATLQTGSNGFVTLVGSEGSRVSLPSQSRARVVRARRYVINGAAAVDVEVLSGRADVSAAKQKPSDTFRVRSPVAVTAVRGTQFRVGYNEAANAGTSEVIEGLVGVSTPKATLPIEAGFGAATSADGTLSREALLPAPQILEPGKVQTEPELVFNLLAVPGARAYHVQVARDAGFVDVLGEERSDRPAVRLTGIANGRMFMRASAIAASGLEGLSEVASFRRQQAGVSASATPGDDGYRFEWAHTGEGTPLYRFQLFDTRRPNVAVVDQPGLVRTGLVIDKLPGGTYQWRVGMIETGPEGSVEVWSDPQKFTATE